MSVVVFCDDPDTLAGVLAEIEAAIARGAEAAEWAALIVGQREQLDHARQERLIEAVKRNGT